MPAKPSKPAPRPPAKQQKKAVAEATHIASGSKVVGEISGTADLVIDGVVEGEIDLESRVVVGSGGRVEGMILARSVEVGGQVLGNVQGLERVEVLATGSLEGDVMAPRVVIAEGAFFKGKVEMTDKAAQRPPKAPKPAQQPAAKPATGSPMSPPGHKQPMEKKPLGKEDRPPAAEPKNAERVSH
ncbi:MAG: polymer-forming cytoskeletal protein [bacterium]|nr:polymer-forming cytoskeletal protein [bacterium]